ncbi:MAG: hypothetical protein RJA07_546 [Bacteroidota bacterium]|jgi:hypothetical protein
MNIQSQKLKTIEGIEVAQKSKIILIQKIYVKPNFAK